MEYILFYISNLFVLFIKNKKFFILCFVFIWFLFVGFRFENGVDWFSTLLMIERSVQLTENFSNNFVGYNLLDSEIFYKFVTWGIYYLNITPSLYVVAIAMVEAVLMGLILKVSPNYKVVAIILVQSFTLHYGFNAIRQGLALIAVVASATLLDRRSGRWAQLIAVTSHWASLALILPFLLFANLNKYKKTLFCTVVITSIISYIFLPLDLIALRFGDAPEQYNLSGFGFKFFYTLSLITITLYLIKPKFYKLQFYSIAALFFISMYYNPAMRYYWFALYFSVIYSSTFPLNHKVGKAALLLLSTSIAIFEWQEIFRFRSCDNCGEWFPYKSILSVLFEQLF